MKAVHLCKCKERKVYGRQKLWRGRKEGRKQFWVVEVLWYTAVNIFFLMVKTHLTLDHQCLSCCQFLKLSVLHCPKLGAEACRDDFLCLMRTISLFESLFSEWASLISFPNKD